MATYNEASSGASKPLLKLKLLDALRSGSFQQLKHVVNNEFQPRDDPNVEEVLQLVLHYAVQVAPLMLIKEIVNRWITNKESTDNTSQVKLDINHQDTNGNTPLHIASYQARGDVVMYLMDQPSINDCVANNSHMQAIEICRDLNVAQSMQMKRSSYVAETAQELRTAFNNRDFQHLEAILTNARNAELLDINGLDPETGDTVLHEFIKKRDVEMCKWLLEHGADPFKRDARGVLPVDLVKKVSDSEAISNPKLVTDVELRKLLDKATGEQSVIDVSGSLHKPPTYRGYLQKWTNFAQGYKLRWFILSADGKLSYYIDQNDTKNACRGSLNMSTCNLHLDSSERLKFEVIGANGAIRWHLKGNHPIETNRWVWAIQGAIRFAKDKEMMLKTGTIPPSLAMNYGLQTMDSPGRPTHNRTHSKVHPNESRRSSAGLGLMNNRGDENLDAAFHIQPASPNLSLNRGMPTPVFENSGSFETGSPRPPMSPGIQDIQPQAFASKNIKQYNTDMIEKDSDDENDEGDDLFLAVENDDEEDLETLYSPYSQEVHMLQRSITMELGSLSEFVSDQSQSNSKDAFHTVGRSLETVTESFEKLNSLITDKDKQMISRLTKQRDVNNVWIRAVKELEFELKDKDERLSALDKERRNLKRLLQKKLQQSDDQEDDEASTDIVKESNDTLEEIAKYIDATKDEDEDTDADEFFDAEELMDGTQKSQAEGSDMNESSETAAEEEQAVNVDESTEKEITHHEGFEKEVVTDMQKDYSDTILKEKTFCGYEEPMRDNLSLDKDERPKISLWSVLKSMVGKDLTKITLPVSFNEPSSLLQRVTEDLEYSNLMDVAATFEDSSLRTLYVAAYSASMYASTVKRVAKPFNPLLGETFEYVSPNGQYRFLTEQVSHHPAISATWGEAPKWNYWGECKVDSNFTGRTFAVENLGTWWIKLRPDCNHPGEELYSWKKPDMAVIGILVGNPQVDNSGDSVITNHTTGDYCVLHYKARGWTSAGAYEVKGEVYNKNNEKLWVLGGHWNEALYAKKVTPKDGEDMTIERAKANSLIDEPKFDGSKFLIWKANERPDIPFNLTSFAVTLNDPAPKLLEWLPPTDSRLRPDQRAMEEGRYDEAAEEKHRLEEKQRAVRRKREEEKIEYAPRWFTYETDSLTGLHYWKFNGEYWKQRRDRKWTDVPDIF
ncbi:Uncharacterized protein RNJ44_01591 [Nakaseomyces bracarensis]|uniref:PH domain-containing protein n=1 Tax=Nakaseomyces bracarensis TaxID=273131 RepID=A0ABR4NQ50_9SACH